jgi:hypothetical protein
MKLNLLRPLWILTLLLFALPAAAHAQDFTYTNNNVTITITGYTGPAGAVTIPSMIDGFPVTVVGYKAFYGKGGLTDVTIPDSIVSIEEQAFRSCGLTSITIGIGVTNVGHEAFVKCSSLTNFAVDSRNPSFTSRDGILFNKGETTLVFYPGARTGDYSIPDGVTGIGHQAFRACDWLTSIIIPDSVTNMQGTAFYDCPRLTNVVIGNGVTWISGETFSRCSSLTSLTLSSNLSHIGETAFSDCTSLTSLALPDSLGTIAPNAFFGCTSLTNVAIPSSVIWIGSGAFSGCISLTSLTLPDSLNTISDRTFYGCTNLTSVYFEGDAPSLGVSVFTGTTNATLYYLPGTTSWSPIFADLPTALWRPQVMTSDAAFGVRTNQFAFNIAWSSGMTVIVDTTTNLSNPTWLPVATNTLAADTWYFADPDWANHPRRFYRLRMP